MTGSGARLGLFRSRSGHDPHRVTYVELLFDLVFVFAVTQLSLTLRRQFTALGVLQTSMLLLSVWWVWVYTSWITNWLDPDRAPVRLMLFALMLAGLALSTSIPQAFGARGIVFACAYAAMQIGRTLFMQWAIPDDDVALRRNFARVLAWLSVAALLWIGGGVCRDTPSRMALWGSALAVEYAGPALRFWTPWLGASSVSDWAIEGGHMAERCSQFVIIALGESLLVTGATFSEATWTPATVAGLVIAFVGSLAMWWIYFDTGVEIGRETIVRAADPGRLGRLAYTYLHLPIVSGIIVTAMANEVLLDDPVGPMRVRTLASLIGGPASYLIGVVLFKCAMRGWLQPSHLVGIGALLAMLPFSRRWPPVTLAAASALVLVGVALWESYSLKGSEPLPDDRAR